MGRKWFFWTTQPETLSTSSFHLLTRNFEFKANLCTSLVWPLISSVKNKNLLKSAHGSPTDASPSQPDTKKCIQVGRETYAVTSQPGTSYSSPDYDSTLVIDSSSPSVPVKHTGEHTSTSEGLRRKKHKTGSKQKRSKTQPKTLEGAWRQL